MCISWENGGYRNPKDEAGNAIGQPFLIPDLEHFATLGRKITICFDHDSKPETVTRVSTAIAQTAKLLSAAGCEIYVVELPGPEKGVDDFIAADGNFDTLYQSALNFDRWQVRQYNRLTFTPALTLNQRYLGNLNIPESAKIVGLKSPKGTGKTESFIPIVSDALHNGQPVLLIGHRVQLVQAIALRVGIPYITEVRNCEIGALLGYGLCVDSLHPKSQAKFNADNWKNALVIIDECEQVIWHTLTASTEVKTHRVEVIRQMAQLLQNVLISDRGRVILSDADLSDLSIQFIRGMAGVDVQPFIVENIWKPEQGWKVYHYAHTSPIIWFSALERHIKQGGKPFIVTQSQRAKSTWGTINLEARLKSQFPKLKILRIDSETIADPTHPAYGCIGKLNEILTDYDIVIASPSIETGVSIDIKGHFTSVWGCFHGVSPDNSARQSLARVREGVVRHLWAAPRGLGQIGNSAISLKSLLASEHYKFLANLRLLHNVSLSFDGDDMNINKTALHTWAKMACRVNAGMARYLNTVLEGLKDEGHEIITAVTPPNNDPDELHPDRLLGQLKHLKKTNYEAEREAIASTDISTLTQTQYEALLSQKSKTKDERNKQRKYSMAQRYQTRITSELIAKDDDGYYSKLRLHYFLTIGKPHLSNRDRSSSPPLKSEGKIWIPDFNRGLMGLSVAALEFLGIPKLLASDRQLRGKDEDLQRLAEIAQAHRWEIKSILGINISFADTPIVILRRLVKKLGLNLQSLGRDGTGDRQRIYQVIGEEDGRDNIFLSWLGLDEVEADKLDARQNSSSTIGIYR